MDPLQIVLRLVHVLGAVLWVGMMFFTTFFLLPAVQETGPEGGKVMGAVQRRGILTIMPLLALGTILSGLWLYWRASLGFEPAYMRSRTGMAFGTGGALGIVAYLLGLAIVRPSMMRAMTIMQTLGSASSDEERQERMHEAQRLRNRSGVAGRTVAWMLLLAAALMAVARYL